MIRFYLQELMATKLFNEGKRVTLTELSEGTGISRVTLSKMVNQRGYNATTDNLDRICAFFGCKIEELVEYVPSPDSSVDVNEQGL